MERKFLIFSTKWITLTALMTALTVVTAQLYLPLPIGNVYLCDAIIFLASFLLDPVSAFLAGGLGTLIADFLTGRPYMAVFSLLIHGIQAGVVSTLIHYVFPNKKEHWWALPIAVLGGLVVVGGYFLTYASIFPALAGKVNGISVGKYGLAYASARVVRNIIQEAIGISVGYVICYPARLKYGLQKSNLLPQLNLKRKTDTTT